MGTMPYGLQRGSAARRMWMCAANTVSVRDMTARTRHFPDALCRPPTERPGQHRSAPVCN